MLNMEEVNVFLDIKGKKQEYEKNILGKKNYVNSFYNSIRIIFIEIFG